MITEKYFTGTIGAYSITEPEIAFVTPITVSRNGVIYKRVILTAPVGREYRYINTGTIEFGTAIEQDTMDIYGARVGEIVYVKYKI